MRTAVVRGATTAENTRESILLETKTLLEKIIEENNIKIHNILSVTFSATTDLTAVYPAVAARELGITNAALFCVQEMAVDDALRKCLRVMLQFCGNIEQKDVVHVYLKEAANLRPDLERKVNGFHVAVDGTAHSGKSTAAQIAAAYLGFLHLNTGATYRAAALYALQRGVDIFDENAVCALLPEIHIKIVHKNNVQKTILNGKNVTARISQPDVTEATKTTSNYTPLRRKMLKFQQNFAKGKNVITDGRDIGSVVFPNAELKIYVDADLEERTRRRCSELEKRNVSYDFAEEMDKLRKRDAEDMSVEKRGNSALRKVEGAIEIDTTHMSPNEVAQRIIDLIKEREK